MSWGSVNGRWGRLAAVPLVGLGILFPVPGASAQSAVDQYLPSANPGEQGGEPGGGDVAPGVGGAAEGGSTAPAPGVRADARPLGVETRSEPADSEDVSVGGYPLTPFIATIAGLLLVGFLARVIVPIVQSRQGSGAGGPD